MNADCRLSERLSGTAEKSASNLDEEYSQGDTPRR